MKNRKSLFVCTECDYQSPRWLGRCPECGAWNTLEERENLPETPAPATHTRTKAPVPAEKIRDMELPAYMRSKTGMGELDRVLGGGLVQGSVVLLSGEPGIGKSTLLMQIGGVLSRHATVLYISGEESGGQLKLRAERLSLATEDMYLLTETSVDALLQECKRLSPDVVIVDSIQTVYSDKLSSSPGSLAQVRESAMAFIAYAKSEGCAVFLVGHVNKEGGISGPKILEHMVDAVLYFEGDKRLSYRMIRAMKNRYGSTNEIGVFEMTDRGLEEVPNPSEAMLEGRVTDASGSAIGCVMEGTRPLICEVQSLVSQTVFPAPRRTADGFDYNRMCLLLAVLEKRIGLRFSANDVYLNVAGGLRIDEPAVDLTVALSLISSITDHAIPPGFIAFGEIGLSGEVRSVSHAENRVREAIRLGFRKIVMPARDVRKNMVLPDGAELIGIRSMLELLPLLKKSDKTL